MITFKTPQILTCLYTLGLSISVSQTANAAVPTNASVHLVPPLISTLSSGDPNVLVILDNSNSMDERANGSAAGSDSSESKSEIARNAVKTLVTNYTGRMNMGLMAYQQTNVDLRQLHDAQYDASFDVSKYDENHTEGRLSDTKKKYQIADPTEAGKFIYYNVTLPFYSTGNDGTIYCQSTDTDASNFDQLTPVHNDYTCYTDRALSLNPGSNSFGPTDSDTAQGIIEFGDILTWQHVGDTWFSNDHTGKGFLHVDVELLDATHATKLNNKLATSTFSDPYTGTGLRNAGLTPLAGSLDSAKTYFTRGTALPAAEKDAAIVTGDAPAVPAICSPKDYVVLVTDGLPSTDANGNPYATVADGIADVKASAQELSDNGVKTFVVGFALPEGTDPTILDDIATAGGTGTAFMASDPGSLQQSLNNIFLSIVNRTSSSTGAAVVANNSKGVGALYQALYNPRVEDSIGNTATWVGSLNSLFFDNFGNFREDSNGNAKLDDSTDTVIQFFFDEIAGRTKIKRGSYTDSSGSISFTSIANLEDLNYIWSARDQLASLTSVIAQRDYASNASTGRHILSSADGASLTNFNVTNDALITAQDAAQAAFDAAKLLDDAADASLATKTANLATATTEFSAAKTELEDATNSQATAQTNYDTSYAAYTPERDSLATSWDAQQLEFSDVETENNNRSSGIDAYELTESALLTAKFDLALELAQGLGYATLADLAGTPDFDAAYILLVNSENAMDAATSDYNVAATTLNTPPLVSLSRAIDNIQFAESIFDTYLGNDEFNVIPFLNNYHETQSTNAGTANDSRNTAYTTLDTSWVTLQASYDALIVDLLAKSTSKPASVVAKQAGLPALEDDRDSAKTTVADADASFLAALNEYLVEANASNAIYDGNFDNLLATVAINNNTLVAANTRLATAQTDYDTKLITYTQAQLEYDTAVANAATTEADLLAATSALTSATAALNAANSSVASMMTLMDVTSGVADTVNYIRGEEISGMRSRMIDFDNDGAKENWRLGDIVHSTPTVVGQPNDKYDAVNNDSTYVAFRNQYFNRRQVVYSGANDGMLHAFNGGFWNDSVQGFVTSLTGSGVTDHPLGSELWAYVPRAALPHLKWLTNTGYQHAFYVDGVPMTYDANIFTPDADHPYGWGTILVVGMRFGGTAYGVDTDNPKDGTADITLRSSFAIFDVTNPEVAPKLIAEVSDPNMGYTTSTPALMKARLPNLSTNSFVTPAKNEWALVWGSGPTDAELDTATSTQFSRMFIYNLNDKTLTSQTLGAGNGDLGNSFINDPAVVDWESDYIDDAVYMGLSTSTTGALIRFNLDGVEQATDSAWLTRDIWTGTGTSVKPLIASEGPFTGKPGTTIDSKGAHWVYAGTGRLWVGPDNVTVGAQSFYGVKEPKDSSGVDTLGAVATTATSLANTTGVTVATDGALSPSVSVNGSSVAEFALLEKAIEEEANGWRVDFASGGGIPAGRNLSSSAIRRSVISFVEYIPNNDLTTCEPEGNSNLYSLYTRTGTWSPDLTFSDTSAGSTSDPEFIAEDGKFDIGHGLASAPTQASTADGGDVNCIQKSGGDINCYKEPKLFVVGGRESWRQLEKKD